MNIKNIIVALLVIIFIAVFPLLDIYGDWSWFSAINYAGVFWTVISTAILLGVVTAVGAFVALYVNMRIAKRGKKKGIQKPFLIIAVLIALFVGILFSSGWDTVLKYNNASEFGVTDPVFGQDVGFYTFILPFYNFILIYLIFITILSLGFSLLMYLIGSFDRRSTKPEEFVVKDTGRGVRLQMRTFKYSKAHVSALIGVLFLLIAVWFYLLQFGLLFSGSGAVFGAAYTDLNVYLPLLLVMSVVSVIAALVFFVSIKKNIKPFKVLTGFGIILLIGLFVGGIVQGFIVQPNEFNLEKPYIERNIEYTLKAYGIDSIDEEAFPVSYDLTKNDIEQNDATIDNIRLWDWRPLLRTYNQLQIFRTYYDFFDVDVDRYDIDGTYKQILLSPRELNQNQLASKARTWVNEHLVYTHGYGVAMSPVNQISDEGLPELYVKDIPPTTSIASLEVTQPEIYYGEETDAFVVVDTTTEEFDYPQQEQNIYTTYNGSGGVTLDLLRRLAYAVKFGSVELLVSGSIKPESKILMYRNIHERVEKIAPFLAYDSDPYMVVSEGKLYWVYDAYTITDSYPYSEPIGSFNYVRNSVKVVIDPYNGDVTYYVIDNEPIIQTYRKIFPVLFKDFSEMPDDLKSHVRYPEDLFSIQAEVYSTYHMKDARVFYNKEDVWKVPNEIYRSTRQVMEPYYVVMELPEEQEEEFILMIPFTPKNKDNMIGWMAARSDGENYGKLLVYLFSKQELVYGPMQIEARIDQDTEISQLITLWDQAGSEVIRGNILVIPIEDSIMYIEPLYLQASETAVPQLKRVIVAYGNHLTMEEDLATALNVIFGTAIPSDGEEPGTKTTEQLIAEANQHYSAAQDAISNGDWATYGSEIAKLGEILAQLRG